MVAVHREILPRILRGTCDAKMVISLYYWTLANLDLPPQFRMDMSS